MWLLKKRHKPTSHERFGMFAYEAWKRVFTVHYAVNLACSAEEAISRADLAVTMAFEIESGKGHDYLRNVSRHLSFRLTTETEEYGELRTRATQGKGLERQEANEGCASKT